MVIQRHQHDNWGKHHQSRCDQSPSLNPLQSGPNASHLLFRNTVGGGKAPVMQQPSRGVDHRSRLAYLPPLVRYGRPQYSSFHQGYDEDNIPEIWRTAGFPPARILDDEEPHFSRYLRDPSRPPSSEGSCGSVPIPAKYECSYCGKGFNRPSSLKVCLRRMARNCPCLNSIGIDPS